MIFTETIFKLPIILRCDEHNKNYLTTIKNKLKCEYEKKAFETFGIIDEIKEIVDIHHEELMTVQPSVHFIVNTLVKTYYPKKNDVINVEIYKILKYGIYIQKDSFRVLIPIQADKHQVQEENGELIFQTNSRTIRPKDEITIQLVDIRYENTGFNCLANLFNDN